MDRRLPVGTKCCAPLLPERLVSRPRLDRRVDADRSQVTLVCGPPGAGKTTLLASWFASAPEPAVAWLSLDRRDGGSTRFAELVATALERTGALPGLAVSQATGEDLLDAVFDQLIGRGHRCLLIMDDLQEVSSRRALQLLAHLVEHAPPLLDLVLASRADPPLRWGRLLVDGRLHRIGNAELTFRTDEAVELLESHDVHLPRAEVRLLCERTEGWAAGLRLAACALQAEAEPAGFVFNTAATQAVVSDYLLTEVLIRQDEADQQFLLRTSVADRITPDLAFELTGDARAGERLAALERCGLFLVELDEDGVYQYHALLRELLRARLRLQDAELLGQLHRRAACWHLARGIALEAESHAREACDWGLVGRLVLTRWLDTVLDGACLEDEPLSGLPPAIVTATPELALVAAAEACSRSHREEADLYRDAADRAVAALAAGPAEHGGADDATAGDDPSHHDPFAWRIARQLLDVAYGRAFGDEARASAATELLRATAGHDAWARRARRLARLRGAELDITAGAIDRARDALEDLAIDGDAWWPADEAAALLAVLDAAAGDVAAAEERVADLPAGSGDPLCPGAAPATQLALALSRAQRAEPRGAVEALAAAEDSPALAAPPLRSVQEVLRAGLRCPTGPTALDDALLDDVLARQVLIALGFLEVVDGRGKVIRVGGAGERAVAEGRRWLAGDVPGRPPEAVEDWLGDTADGSSLQPGPPGHPRTVIEARLLAAVLSAERGDDEHTQRHLTAALELATASGVRAPFASHGAHIRPLLERRVTDHGTCAGLALELADRLAPEAVTPVEPLTDRERQVLHHLPTLMSNVEIAAGMQLSVNTVKTHLKAVYRKLGVEGRRQAVLRGRELELI